MEEITSSYIVVRIWDERRMVVPLQWIIENPFQNWTRTSAELLGTVLLWVDFQVPLAPLRAELERLCKEAPEWDGRLAQLQAVDASERAMQIRALVSANDSSPAAPSRRPHLAPFVTRAASSSLTGRSSSRAGLAKRALIRSA